MRDELLPFLAPIYQRRRLVVMVAVVVFVLAGVREALSTRSEAELILVLNRLEGPEELASLIPSVMSPKTYKELIESPNVLQETLETLKSQGTWKDVGDGPDLETFMQSLRVEISVVDQTTRPINYSPLIRLVAVGRDPERARAIVSTWADVSVDAAAKAGGFLNVNAANSIGGETDSQKARLEEVWNKLAADKSSYNTEKIQQELQLLVQTMSTMQTTLAQAETRLASAGKRLETVRTQLQEEPQTINLFRAPSDDAYWLSESTGSRSQVDADLKKKGMLTEELNPTYVTLKSDETDAEQEVASARAEIESLNAELEKLAARRDQLQRDLAEHEAIQKMWESEGQVLKDSYVQVAGMGEVLAALSSLSTVQEDEQTIPVGLNRLTSEVAVREATTVVGSKGRILITTALALILVIAYALVRDLGLPLLQLEKLRSAAAPSPGPSD